MLRRELDSRLDKWDVFQEKSTYLNDYRYVSPDERVIKKWKNDTSEKPKRPAPRHELIDQETYVKWKKDFHIPFNLLWRPEPIIGTNPQDQFELPEEVHDEQKEEALKTRPRIYMAPAVSMDDIPDPNMRDLLIKFMYTTDWKRATEEAKLPITEKKVPKKVAEFKGDPVALKIETVACIPEGWSRKTKSWDKEQARSSVDPTKQFWFSKDPPVKCGACENPLKGIVTKETKQKIRDLIDKDRLRVPYDYNKPGYTGYVPRMVGPLPMEKTNLHFTHPLLSVTEAIQSTNTKELASLE